MAVVAAQRKQEPERSVASKDATPVIAAGQQQCLISHHQAGRR